MSQENQPGALGLDEDESIVNVVGQPAFWKRSCSRRR
jgi:hypothetical protein